MEIKRVLQVLEGLHCGGTETVVMNWLRNIDKTKIRFDFALYNLDDMFFENEITKYGSKIFSIKPKIKNSFKTSWYIAFNLYKLIKQEKNFTVLQTHEEQPFVAGLQVFVAFVAGIKKRVTISHVNRNEYSNEIKQSLKNKVKVFIGRLLIRIFSNKHLAVSEQAGIAMYGENIDFMIIKNGIDTEKFKFDKDMRHKSRKELNLENKFVMGHIGRFEYTKNQCFIIEILNEVLKYKRDVSLLLIGEGSMEKEIKEKIKNLQLDEYVKLLSTRKDVNKMYQVMDCFIFPSFYEGLGIVAIEAQCSGLPCFISDGVPSEAMICNTIKIPLSNSAKEWADTILERIKNFERRDCSNIIKNKGFDSKKIGGIIQKIYE